MAIQGLRDTENFVANQRPTNYREGIMLLEPNGSTPLYALTSMMKSQDTDDPRFAWWEKELEARRVALGADIDTSQTSFTLVGGALGYKDGDLLRAEHTGEVLLVNGDPTVDTTIVVIRGYGGTTAVAITYAGAGVNPNLMKIGSAYEEGSNAPTGVNFDPEEKYNYTQIFRSTLEMTATAMQTRLRTGDQVKEAKRETFQYHKLDIEDTLWWGVRFQGVRNGKPIRMTQGVINSIPAGNLQAAGSTTTMLQLEEYLRRAFQFGSSEKMAFCGDTAALVLQQIIRRNSDSRSIPGLRNTEWK
ncbi:MAG: DUF5309 domain-containing protein [Bdellovibrionaceae bacterium]|nr:DUF5309 domain-containing protein [Pseudobdellovibrionaceae bacterium]